MKNAVEPTKTTIETQAFSAQRAELVRGVDPQQLLEEAAEGVERDVEREQRRRPDRKRRSTSSRTPAPIESQMNS